MKNGEKMSETQNQTQTQNQEKVIFKKIIHLDFIPGEFYETFKPTYILYTVEWLSDIYEIFVARSKRGRIFVLKGVGKVNVALMRTRSSLAIDIAGNRDLPGGEILENVRINDININEDGDVTVITYYRNGQASEVRIPKKAIEILSGLLYYPKSISALDAVLNYTI